LKRRRADGSGNLYFAPSTRTVMMTIILLRVVVAAFLPSVIKLVPVITIVSDVMNQLFCHPACRKSKHQQGWQETGQMLVSAWPGLGQKISVWGGVQRPHMRGASLIRNIDWGPQMNTACYPAGSFHHIFA